VGYDRVHVAIDGTTGLAYVEVLADEQQALAIGFMSRALARLNGQGAECHQVMSDNRTAYISRRFAKACKTLCIKYIRTRSYTPRANGKPNHYIQALCKEIAYSMPLQNSVERNLSLAWDLSICNRLRKHFSLGDQSPQ
jgi:hypothetical protein